MNILLVEDNLPYAKLISNMLEINMPVKIFHALSLKETLEYLKKENVDIILLDLNLSDSPGLGPIKEIHARYPNIPILVITSLNAEGLEAQVLKCGAQKYLAKEKITFEILSKAVYSLISK